MIDADVPSLLTIEDEIRAGLPMAADRLDCAQANQDFLNGENCKHLEPRRDEKGSDFDRRPKVYSRFVRMAVDKLTSLLYTPGPARPPAGVSARAAELLDRTWAANHVNVLMEEADRGATLNDCVAIQALATGRDDMPIRLYLWGAEEFQPFFRDDPTDPWAVVTVSVMTGGRTHWRRYEAWSAREHRVYETRRLPWTEELPTTGGRVADYRPALSGEGGDGRNPYGCLPFSFAWNRRPIKRFWGSGIGTMLRETNEVLDRLSCDVAEHVEAYLHPDLYFVNVAAGATVERKPNQPIHLPAQAGDNSLVPTAFYLQATLGVRDSWWNLDKVANRTLHELGVPLSAVRDDQQGPQSGFQVVAEQGPLLDYTRKRQPRFGEYEESAARLILRVAGGYYPGLAGLAAEADALRLGVAWSKPAPSVASAEADDHESHDLEARLASRVTVLMDRGMTREQAEERLARVQEDLDREA